VLYCDVNALTGAQSERRRAYRTVLDILFHALVRWLAPVLVFTSEEVWGTRFPDAGSVHLLEWPQIGSWEDVKLMDRWVALRAIRTRVTEAVEPLRRDKEIGSSLQAQISIFAPGTLPQRFAGLDLAELFITAPVRLCEMRDDDFEVEVKPTEYHKCGRCWRHLPEVAEDGALCARCDEVVNG
jgi:isoleucyl-tRNA synthetase